MAERRRMEKANCLDHHGIREAARADGAVSEVEHLAQRAQVLPMAVGEFMTQRRPRVRPDDSLRPRRRHMLL